MRFREYPIYKKRDGQSYEQVSYVYSDSFEDAKKQFAKRMTEDNHNLSNDIQWLDKETDGVNETGWYDFSGGYPTRDERTEKYEADEAVAYLFCSEEAIDEGFDSWNEDVYTWEIKDINLG
jgi:hypothetical protein